MTTDQGPQIGLVMLIDDNRIDQMLYRRIIERSGRVGQVLSYLMAEEALDYLVRRENPRPDVIFLDINMPRMDGFEFLEAATARLGPDFGVVIVMLTTSLDPQDQKRASQFEAVKDYLDKPLTLEHLDAVAALVEEGAP